MKLNSFKFNKIAGPKAFLELKKRKVGIKCTDTLFDMLLYNVTSYDTSEKVCFLN